MFEGVLEGLELLARPEVIALLLFGTAIGTIAAILPGISPATMMAMLLPLTFTMEPAVALAFLTTLMGAGGFAGSITAILLNVPGDATNAATLLDGYPLSRQGKAGVAIGATALASALGALFGVLVLILLMPFAREAVLAFGPPEFFALAMAGILLIGAVSGESPLRGLVSGLLGLAIGMIGFSTVVGSSRYTLGIDELRNGVPLVPALIGLFAIPELVDLVRRNESVSLKGIVVAGGVWEGCREVLRRPVAVIRSSLIGIGVGVVPGVGAQVASWTSYFVAVRTSKDPASFGKGNIEGVIASEASMDAKEGAALLPVLALGLPAGVSTVFLLAGLLVHGIAPGPRLFQTHMDVVWLMIFGLIISNLVTSALGLAFANQLVKVTLIPPAVLAPIIVSLGVINSIADRRALYGLGVVLVFGVIGVAMKRFEFSRAAFLVGMLLLPIVEENFHLSILISRGEYTWLLRPITLGVLAVAAAAVATPAVLVMVRRRRRRGQGTRSAAGGPSLRTASPFEWVFIVSVVVIGAYLLTESFGMTSTGRLFPTVVSIPLLIGACALVFRAARAGLRRRRSGQPVQSDQRDQGGESARSDLWVVAWLVVLIALIYLVGVLIGAGVFTAAFILFSAAKVPSRRQVLTACAIGGLVPVSSYLLFVEALAIRFPVGILGF